jgi:hypothetical protein
MLEFRDHTDAETDACDPFEENWSAACTGSKCCGLWLADRCSLALVGVPSDLKVELASCRYLTRVPVYRAAFRSL